MTTQKPNRTLLNQFTKSITSTNLDPGFCTKQFTICVPGERSHRDRDQQ
jgi:hypothetical protein